VLASGPPRVAFGPLLASFAHLAQTFIGGTFYHHGAHELLIIAGGPQTQ